MFWHYVKIASRNLRKDKVNSFINVLGMGAALTSLLLILLFVRYELSYDTFHKKSDRIFRITYESRGMQTRHLATVSPPMGPALAARYPEVEKAVRIRYTDGVILTYEDERYYEQGFIYADSTFLEIFDFKLRAGNASTALDQPNSVIITPEIATKYFGNQTAIGKTILLDNETPLLVTGVFEQAPRQTHFQFNFVTSFSTFQVPYGYPVTLQSWGWVSFQTYVLLKPGTSPKQLETKLPQFLVDNMGADRAQSSTLNLQPLSDIYFHSGSLMNTDDNRQGNLPYVKGLSVIAFLILLVAAFNFMNITIARSVGRGKEVGVRKVLGALPGSLVRQFLGEAILLTVLSLSIAVVLLSISSNHIIRWLEWDIAVNWQDFLPMIPFFLVLTLIAGGVAGLYPAFILSKFRPTGVLKGEIKTGNQGNAIRKVLVVAQFVIMTSLTVGSLVVKEQMEFIRNRDLGFDKEQVITLQLQTPAFLQYYERAKTILKQNPRVASISAGDIFDGDYGSVPVTFQGVDPENMPTMYILGAHFDYFKTTGIDIVAGREFLETFPSDTTNGIILNESAVKMLGWENPIGQTIQIGEIREGKVVGIAKDFHFQSLHDPIMPMAILMPETMMRHILIRLHPGDVSETLASLQSDWNTIAPGFPFDVSFVDEQIQQRYQADQGFSKLIYLFSLLTILIAASGLYGLIAIIASFKVREIGIRKVLGASVGNIVTLLTKEFIMLVLIGAFIALPLAWWAMSTWLDDFAYRIDLQWWMFVLASLGAISIALFTVSFQAIRAAVANPVDSLKTE